MIAPMVVLFAIMVGIALFPRLVIRGFGSVLSELAGKPMIAADVPLDQIGWVNGGLWLTIGAGALLLRYLLSKRPSSEDATWGCGYTAPTPRMQYVARSFSALRARIWRESEPAIFHPRTTIREDDKDPVTAERTSRSSIASPIGGFG